MIINGKTKSGIKFQIDERVKDDARFLYYLTKAQDENSSMSDKSSAVMDVMKLLFGTDENVIAFMDAVAGAHDGFCSVEFMLLELTELFDALKVKN